MTASCSSSADDLYFFGCFLNIAVKSIFPENHSGKKAQFPHIFVITY